MELLLCLSLLSVLGALSYSFARAALMNLRLVAARVETREAVVLAIDAFAREVRLAGYSQATAVTAVPAASDTALEIAADLNGNGSLADSSERVAYRYSSARQTFGRATGGSGAQPILSDVPSTCVRLSYFDNAGGRLGGAGDLSDSERERVRRVRLFLCSEVTVAGFPTKVRTELALSVARRNP